MRFTHRIRCVLALAIMLLPGVLFTPTASAEVAASYKGAAYVCPGRLASGALSAPYGYAWKGWWQYTKFNVWGTPKYQASPYYDNWMWITRTGYSYGWKIQKRYLIAGSNDTTSLAGSLKDMSAIMGCRSLQLAL